jgi:hypothetical protein
MMPQDSFERELTCRSITWTAPLWPTHKACYVAHIDFSEKFRSEKHSFSGSTSKKLEFKAFHMYNCDKFDFIPVDIFVEFPNLNGLYFSVCYTPVVKSGLFTVEFQKLEYLHFQAAKVESIEASAFEHLVNLKWISFDHHTNKIQSLPFSVFKSNPNLIYVSFGSNKINSINPNLFKNLDQLKIVDFTGNQCVDKKFGCESCSLSQSDLENALSNCFTNCQNDEVCSVETSKNDSTTDQNSNLQTTENNLAQEIIDHLKKIEETLEEKTMALNRTTEALSLEIESLKNTVGALQTAEKNCKSDAENLKEKMDSLIETVTDNTTNALSSCKEEAKEFNKIVTLQISEAKTTMEYEKLQWKLREAEQIIEKQRLELQMEKMKREFGELKTKLEQQARESEARETTLKNELDEIVNKKLAVFKKELMEDDRA